MKEVRTIIPVNSSRPELLNGLNERIIDAAGGYTSTAGVGSWRNPDTGEIVYEPGLVYDIAIADESVGLAILNAVMDYGLAAGEHSMYYRGFNGEVSILDVAEWFTV